MMYWLQGRVMNCHPLSGYNPVKPENSFGNARSDVLADKHPDFIRGNFCAVIPARRGADHCPRNPHTQSQDEESHAIVLAESFASQLRRPARVLCLAAVAAALFSSAAVRVADGQTSLSLEQAIRMAQNSPAARIAKSEINAMQGQLRQAGMRPNPRLFLQSEDLRPWASDYTFSQQTEDYGYVNQTLEIDGKRGKRMEVAGEQLRETEAQRSLQLLQMDGRVASGYWQAVAAARLRDCSTRTWQR